MKDCDTSAITALDDQTLQGTIIVEDCPCEARFANNASRMAAVSAEVTTQLNAYMDDTHGDTVKYQCTVQAVSGDGTETTFHYVCIVPLSSQAKAILAMQQCCTNDQVIALFILNFLFVIISKDSID